MLDEPTTGLHFHDLQKLLKVLQALVDKGHSVIAIEHNMDFIKNADWILDIGPYAGDEGGTLVFNGTLSSFFKKNTPTALSLNHPLSTSKEKKQKPSHENFSPIHIEGATQNNLKNLTLDIPHQKISLFTGPCGSGKTSLALETIHNEGQRRYIESLSPYIRQFLPQMPKSHVEKIEGLTPTIAMEHKASSHSPRSTLGTLTETHDLLRLLFAHLGEAFCPETKEKIQTITKQFVVDRLLKTLSPKEKFYILSPIVFHKNELFSDFLERWKKHGFLRIRVNGTYYEFDQEIPYDPNMKNELFLVVDRLLADTSMEKRLLESLQMAEKISNGIILIGREKKEDLFFHLSFAVEKTGKSYPSLTPQTFSFNSEQGMCLECHGLGTIYGFHLPFEFLEKSILDICHLLFKRKGGKRADSFLKTYFSSLKIDPEIPLSKLSKKHLFLFLHGTDDGTGKNPSFSWKGLATVLEKNAKQAKFLYRRALVPLMEETPCPECHGFRLNPLARNVLFHGKSITELESISIDELFSFFQHIHLEKNSFLQEPLLHLEQKLSFLKQMDLGYLSLLRSTSTLSSGELQRAYLSKYLSQCLTSCTYILDEPSLGLHPHHCDLLFLSLKRLKELGNTLILVEHNPKLIEKADLLFTFGPFGGKKGGYLLSQKTKKDPKIEKRKFSPSKKREFSHFLRIEKASLHNLKNISISFPMGAISCLTGISGAGKSTLFRILKKGVLEGISRRDDVFDSSHGTVSGISHFEKLVVFDRFSFSLTQRSDVGTYSEILPLIRLHFSSLLLSKTKGFLPGHFSYNHKKGMCLTCQGLGYKTVDLKFLPSVSVLCEHCLGNRLSPSSLEVLYKGKHFGDVLKMSLEEAFDFFSEIPSITRKLKTFLETGIGYLQLGQTMQTLSRGEFQLISLSKELSKRSRGKNLYLLDEPTSGLDKEGIEKLFLIFKSLADKKNTLILIEHNLEMISKADFIVDLGPKGGFEGGNVVYSGEIPSFLKNQTSLTAKYLKESFF